MVAIKHGNKVYMSTPDTPLTDPRLVDDSDTDGGETSAAQFTEQQWNQLCELLALDAEQATADDVLTAVTALTDPETDPTEVAEKIAARGTGPAPTIIDGETWQHMQTTLKIGLRAQNQEKRVAAEQIVDEAIRFGKARSVQRESLIQSYNLDPEETMRRLRKGKEVPHFEIGHGMDPDTQGSTPDGWVR